MGNVFFTSDEHFNHANIIKFCNRPFKDTAEMTERLIENHNSVVKPGDRVYHLGDMFWRTTSLKEALEIRYRLKGEHYFIYGNHDEVIERNKVLQDSFVWCRDVENLYVQGYEKIWLSHYAHRVWNGSHRGAYHLYGHTHAVLPEDGSLSFDCGVDAQNYMPISIEDVQKKMSLKLEAIGTGCFKCRCGHTFMDKYRAHALCARCGEEMRKI